MLEKVLLEESAREPNGAFARNQRLVLELHALAAAGLADIAINAHRHFFLKRAVLAAPFHANRTRYMGILVAHAYPMGEHRVRLGRYFRRHCPTLLGGFAEGEAWPVLSMGRELEVGRDVG